MEVKNKKQKMEKVDGISKSNTKIELENEKEERQRDELPAKKKGIKKRAKEKDM